MCSISTPSSCREQIYKNLVDKKVSLEGGKREKREGVNIGGNEVLRSRQKQDING